MNDKKLETVVSWARIVSALAVIVSLLYVGYEFRRTSALTSQEVDGILFERAQKANSTLVESSGIAEIVLAAARAPDEMSEADRLRYLAYQHNFFDSWEIAWNYHEDDILDVESWTTWDEWFAREAMLRPRFGWTENRHNHTGTGFRTHVDEVLSMTENGG